MIPLNEWTVLMMIWRGSTDKKIALYRLVQGEDGIWAATEFAYDSQVAGVGAQSDDSAQDAAIGNFAAGGGTFDGLIDTFRLYGAVLVTTDCAWFNEIPLHLESAPQAAPFPFAVEKLESVTQEWNITCRIDNAAIGISIYTGDETSDDCSGDEYVGLLAELTWRCFQCQRLTIEEHGENLIKCQDEDLVHEEKVWQKTLSLSLWAMSQP
jgi:hypothetical protein